MKCPVHIQTKQGVKEWEAIYSKYNFAKEKNISDWFKQYCHTESLKTEVEIIHFLEKTEHELDNSPELMLQWKEMSDRQSLHHYFSRIIK